MPLTDFELGWLVGLLEGEGHFRHHNKTQRVTFNTTDEDVVYKVSVMFQKITGVPCNPSVKDMGKYNPNAKPQYYLQLYGEKARAVMLTVVRHMAYRRRQRIWQCLNKHEAPSRTNAPYKIYDRSPITFGTFDRRM
jgi:hypothetical protein